MMLEENGRKQNWEREVLEKALLAAVAEQRKARRWGIFFKSLIFVYLFMIFVVVVEPFSEGSIAKGKAHTAVVNVIGTINEGSDSDASQIIKGLRAAIEDKGTKGIILRMNTPGGTPVQAAYVYDEIKRIKQQKPDLPIYAVVSDMCASGGYYIASAADKIFVNQASIIGSIGVIMNGFGFVDAMDKLGIERRLMIAGTHKAILDPFSPVSTEEKIHVQALLNRVHQQFIEAVRQGRGQRLHDDPDIFSGLVWTGGESIELGLADAIGSTDSVARKIIGAETIVDFTQKEGVIDRLAGRLGTSFGQVLLSAIKAAGFSMR
jgi:protease IV